MSLVLTSGPAVEPVTLAEAKAHLRVDGTADDVLIQSLILTSRLHIEAALGLALITQSWSYFLDAWPRSGSLALPLHPVQSIPSIRLWQADGSNAAVSAASFILDGNAHPPRLVWGGTGEPPAPGRRANGVEIVLTAGYGSTGGSVPSPIRHALLLLLAHWYENREAVEIGSSATAIPATVSELLAPYRGRHL